MKQSARKNAKDLFFWANPPVMRKNFNLSDVELDENRM